MVIFSYSLGYGVVEGWGWHQMSTLVYSPSRFKAKWSKLESVGRAEQCDENVILPGHLHWVEFLGCQ